MISVEFTCTLKVEKHWSRLELLRETRSFRPLLLHTLQTSVTSWKYGRTLVGGGAHGPPPASWKDSSLTLVQGRTYDQPLTYIGIDSDEGSNPLSTDVFEWPQQALVIHQAYQVYGIGDHPPSLAGIRDGGYYRRGGEARSCWMCLHALKK